jgi:hypothetical protein
LLTHLRIAAHFGRSEGVEGFVVDRIYRDKLTLQVGRELSDLNAVLFGASDQLLAVADAVGGLLEVDEPAVPGRDLHAFVAEARRPAADRVEGVERRVVAGELGEENCRSLDRFHGRSSLSGVRLSLDGARRQAFAHCSRKNLPPNW